MTVMYIHVHVHILTVAETLSQSVTKLLTPSPINAPAALHINNVHHVHNLYYLNIKCSSGFRVLHNSTVAGTDLDSSYSVIWYQMHIEGMFWGGGGCAESRLFLTYMCRAKG